MQLQPPSSTEADNIERMQQIQRPEANAFMSSHQQFSQQEIFQSYFLPFKKTLPYNGCLNNCMQDNQFKKGELYSFITGKASIAIARRLQKKFNTSGLQLTIEQWSVLYHLWKEDGKSQQELCTDTFRDKPSITRLVDNLEKLGLVKRVPSEADRRINKVYLTKAAQKLQEQTMQMAEETLNEALEGVPAEHINLCKEVLQKVYDNLK